VTVRLRDRKLVILGESEILNIGINIGRLNQMRLTSLFMVGRSILVKLAPPILEIIKFLYTIRLHIVCTLLHFFYFRLHTSTKKII